MEFNIEQQELYKGIQIVQKAVASKKTMPILTGIFLKAKEDNSLNLIGTDLELGIEHKIEADVKKPGSIVIPSTHITNLIRELPQEEINFKADLEHFEAKLECLNSKFELKGYNPEEYPQLPTVNTPTEFTLPTEILKRQIEEIEFSTSKDETQPALTGSLFSITEDNMTMVATNTYRLAYSQKEIETGSKEDIEVILPGKTLNELNRLLEGDTTKILINSNYASFEFNNINVISRLIEGKFPNYQQVMPKECNTILRVEKEDLQRAVKRASLIARTDSNVITLQAKEGRLIIDSASSETGHAHEEITIEKEGPEQKINIDAGYLLDGLKVLKEDEVNIELIGPINPLTVKKPDQDNYIYLIMPIRSD